jgi:hypothetical protein
MPRKVFTAGEVLAAADVNNFLMDQTVMSFAGTAARGSAIGTATEGMYTHLEDTDRLQFWNGSAWKDSSALILLNTTDFSAATSISVDNVFSALYRNYKILLNVDSSTSANIQIRMRMRVAGADDTNTNYFFGNTFVGSLTSLALGSTNASNGQAFALYNSHQTYGGNGEINVFNPFLSRSTSFTSAGNGAYFMSAGGNMNTTNSYTGFTLIPDAGNITGSLRVYGVGA